MSNPAQSGVAIQGTKTGKWAAPTTTNSGQVVIDAEEDDQVTHEGEGRDGRESFDFQQPQATKTRTEPPPLKWYQKISIHGIVGGMADLLKRITAFPMVSSEAIYFDEDDRYDPAGNRRVEPTHDGDPQLYPMGEKVEIDANYERATKEMFEAIIRYRKEAKNAKDNYHSVTVDLKKFKEWDEAQIDRLRSTFQVFDRSGDGLVDFEDMCNVLEEFGDTCENSVRKKFFDLVDDGSGSIDFLEFLKMVHTVTVRTPHDDGAEELAQSFRTIDRNMARIRSLDVVQKLQAGLF